MVLAFTDHDLRDMRPDVDDGAGAAGHGGGGIPGRSVPVLRSDRCHARARSTSRTQPPCELDVTLARRSTTSPRAGGAVSSVPTFGPQPWLALKTVAGTYHHDNFDIDVPHHRWRYVLDEDTFPLGALSAVGVAAANSYGTSTVCVLDPATGTVTRRTWNS